MKMTCLQFNGLKFLLGIFLAGLCNQSLQSQSAGADARDLFRQLNDEWPSPNEQRLASGAPGPEYWQQRADYKISVSLDEHTNRLSGTETITYHNHSPHILRYLWMQVENQIFDPLSLSRRSETAPNLEGMDIEAFRNLQFSRGFDGSVELSSFRDASGASIQFSRVDTNVRVHLPEPLHPGDMFTFSLNWEMPINDATRVRARTGFEFFEEDGNAIYELAHWYPRMVAYTDYTGWQHKSFLGRGEFTLEFGDFDVEITVPADHIVAATGVLQNPQDVLTSSHLSRLESAATSSVPVQIITESEARENQKSPADGTITWRFQAENVRDFAWASSRKFLWDAMAVESGGKTVMAMSYYPPEAEPLWSRYSTQAVAHTIEVYSRFTFDYPYPVAISVNGPVGGMEYPMICFNGPRAMKDGTYFGAHKSPEEWPFSKYGLISVVIHEVGHNYFPMIVNSDERRWTWMDEGLNTFLQFLAEQEWEDNYPSRRGEPDQIISYMTSSRQVPVMSHSDLIHQFGNNAYAKPATALNILRETVLGRELFDFSFREYAQRWMFKRPEPFDFFRSMEDASGVDLDWFWTNWFYSTTHCDIAIGQVDWYQVSSQDPVIEKPIQRTKDEQKPITLSESLNKPLPKRADRFPQLKDFYNSYDPFDVTADDREKYQKFIDSLTQEEKDLLKTGDNFYRITFDNIGGLISPMTLKVTDDRDQSTIHHIPAEIWRRNAQSVPYLIVSPRPLKSWILDPFHESPDSDRSNNQFPRQLEPQRFDLKKSKLDKNPMQLQKESPAKAPTSEPNP